MPQSMEPREAARDSAAGDTPENNSPSDTLPPRRRRRAASRPAGPPSAPGAEAPAAEPVEATTVVADSAPAAPAALSALSEQEATAEAAPEPAAPPRRRRAARKATAPAGAPKAAEEPEAVTPEAVTPDAEEAEEAGETAEEIAAAQEEAAAEAVAAEDDELSGGTPAAEPAEAAAAAPEAEPAAEAEAAPRTRTRRRAVRKATAPAGAPTVTGDGDLAEPTVVGDQTPAVAPADETASAAPGEEAPRRTRRRAVRKATAPAGAPAEVAAAAEGTEAAQGGAPEAAAPAEAPPQPLTEGSVTVADAVEAPRGRTRRRSARRSETGLAAPELAPVADDAAVPSRGETAAAPGEAEQAEGSAAEGQPARSRRRAERRQPAAEAGTETGAGAGAEGRAAFTAPAAEPEPEPEPSGRTRRRAVRPPTAVFQAPVFTEPMFQTPERAAAAAAAEAEEPGAAEAEERQPAAATGGPRRRRRRAGAAEDTGPEAGTGAAAEEEQQPEAAAEPQAGEEESGERPSRRRRRGGRRRRRGEGEGNGEAGETGEEGPEGAAAEDAGEPAAERDRERAAAGTEEQDERGEHDEQEEDHGGAGGTSSSRRRRRRRRRSGDAGDHPVDASQDDPERTVVKIREPRKKDEPGTGFDEVQSIKGSTRMEAKKQRRREGREQGRRRVPIITEAEFLARREAVERVMVVRQSGERTQIGVLEDGVLVEHFVNKEQATSYVGNVYLGKVQNVLPSMEAAFVDIGKGRNAVLYAGEVNFDALGMSGGPRRIETALKSGQSVLVQVTKDPIGHKGARLTSQVSLPGRYLVYVPEGSMTGISRKLPDTERSRLKQILKKIVPEDAGVIVRTAAEGASEQELARDVERLQQQWAEIQKKAKGGGAPTLLYGEPDMTVRVVRDIFNEDFSKVIVSGDGAWETIQGYVSHVAPDLTDRLQKWTSDVDVFATYRIDEQLMKALDRKVWLPSGGSLVIDRTEAMVVVDVNTGKFTGQGGNLEETVTRNNLEAAEEIVRQLRLRDLGGIIVIDFIDMVLESNRDLVLRRLLECLGRDRTKHQVAEVTSLGLVQMTRKRVGQGLLESFSETCVHCNGRGVIVHMEQPSAPGGGGKRKKKGKGGAAAAEPHIHAPEPSDIGAGGEAAVAAVASPESPAEVAAEAAEPVALPEPAFSPDEDLYSSAAEAEAAASRVGRGRRRAVRKASAPAGPPKAAAEEAVVVVAPAEPEERPETVAETVAEPAAGTAPEPAPAEAVAPPARTRRRAVRKASAPAGPPKGTEEPEEKAVVVVSAGEPVVAGETEPGAPEAAETAATEPAPAKKAAKHAAAKKVTAKKAAAKKTAAKKTAAKKEPGTAKKAAAKKATAKKAATRKTAQKAAATEQSSAPAAASADES
ncbi:Rne/Rng family ribonuclease [Streptomyces sp. WAC 00631]|uniref:Rne/Rng family ribonuclease n=1 Tax=Streptomyces sp. WAC 00631 TaxID=2203201 RepID=UPI000F76BB02|nr:Rne/Rng family ribonuclease [Streptomyces sp. WAC 00631]MCC5035015.1 Rne/Rng family ribonuclease [Streptomyces sp. WAC 00631]